MISDDSQTADRHNADMIRFYSLMDDLTTNAKIADRALVYHDAAREVVDNMDDGYIFECLAVAAALSETN